MILVEDHINPSGDGAEPISAYPKPDSPEFDPTIDLDVTHEHVVASKGEIWLEAEYNDKTTTQDVLVEVFQERKRQFQKFGDPQCHPLEFIAILGEEFGEVSKAAVEAHFNGYETTGNWDDYRKELIQVAAVAVQMVEALDKKRANAKSSQ